MINRQWFKEQNACNEFYEWICSQYTADEEIEPVEVIKKLINWDEICEITQQKNLISNFQLHWANRIICEVFTHEQKINYILFAVAQAIQLFEKEHPDDNRPRQAVESAIKYLESPTKENKIKTKEAIEAATEAATQATAQAKTWEAMEATWATQAVESARKMVQSTRITAWVVAAAAWVVAAAAWTAVGVAVKLKDLPKATELTKVAEEAVEAATEAAAKGAKVTAWIAAQKKILEYGITLLEGQRIRGKENV